MTTDLFLSLQISERNLSEHISISYTVKTSEKNHKTYKHFLQNMQLWFQFQMNIHMT